MSLQDCEMLQDSVVASYQRRAGIMGTHRAVPFLPGNNLVSLTTLQSLLEVISDFIFGVLISYNSL